MHPFPYTAVQPVTKDSSLGRARGPARTQRSSQDAAQINTGSQFPGAPFFLPGDGGTLILLIFVIPQDVGPVWGPGTDGPWVTAAGIVLLSAATPFPGLSRTRHPGVLHFAGVVEPLPLGQGTWGRLGAVLTLCVFLALTPPPHPSPSPCEEINTVFIFCICKRALTPTDAGGFLV